MPPITLSTESLLQQELMALGRCDAVVTGVVDLKILNTLFGPKDSCDLEYTTEHKSSTTGQNLKVTQRYTKSLNPKSNLRRDVEAILDGQPLPKQFCLDDLVGRRCQLMITHRTGKDGRRWNKVERVMPASSKQQAAPISNSNSWRGNIDAFRRNNPSPAGGVQSFDIAAREAR